MAAADTETVVILSPYLTSKTPEKVLANVEPGCATICTSFSAELFASGASSLKTLKNLARAGHELFHLDDLHAKVFLVPGKFASIGSQNLTRNGTRRKEAGTALSNIDSVAIVERETLKWLEEATPITAEMIGDMEKELGALAKKFRAARREATKLDREVRDRQAARVREKRWRLQTLQRTLDQGAAPQSELDAEVRSVPSSSGLPNLSLVALNGRHLTKWKVGESYVHLSPKRRYLCVFRDTGKIGWARLMKTRITFVGNGVDHDEPITMGEHRYRLSQTADWSAKPRHERNVTVSVHEMDGTKLCVVSLFLSISGAEVTHVRQLQPRRVGARAAASQCASFIERRPHEFARLCLPGLVNSFVYSRRLIGAQADEFFGPVRTRVTLSIATIGDQRIIVVT